jgi:hypothetical protein
MGMWTLYNPADEGEHRDDPRRAHCGDQSPGHGRLLCRGQNELLLREALRARPRWVVLRVKFGVLRCPGGEILSIDGRTALVKNSCYATCVASASRRWQTFSIRARRRSEPPLQRARAMFEKRLPATDREPPPLPRSLRPLAVELVDGAYELALLIPRHRSPGPAPAARALLSAAGRGGGGRG